MPRCAVLYNTLTRLVTNPLRFAGITLGDSNNSHGLQFVCAENLTQDCTLRFVVNDASRTVTIAGDATISGNNTGDQTITLTGPVTGSGTGSFATTITNGAVTMSKIAQAGAVSGNAIVWNGAAWAPAAIPSLSGDNTWTGEQNFTASAPDEFNASSTNGSNQTGSLRIQPTTVTLSYADSDNLQSTVFFLAPESFQISVLNTAGVGATIDVTSTSIDFSGVPVSFSGQNLTNIADPIDPQDAATKAWVEANFTPI